MSCSFVRYVRYLVILVVAATLAACGPASQMNGFVKASPKDVEIVNQGGYSAAATAQIAIFQNPMINGGHLSAKALQLIEKLSISCQNQADQQIAGPGQSGANGAVMYGVAGAGTGPAASLAFTGAKIAQYATYGGVSYILPGAVNGLVTGSYSADSVKGGCTRDFWEQIVNTDPEFKGAVVEIVYAGKRMGNSAPPALLNRDGIPPSTQK